MAMAYHRPLPHSSVSPIVLLPVFNYSTPVYIEQISKLNSYNYPAYENPKPSAAYSTFPAVGSNNHPFTPTRINELGRHPEKSFPPFLQSPKRHDQSNSFDQRYSGSTIINRRDGYGLSGKQSPAISALALLGFLFFLNLIQNSLQNNRFLLTSVPIRNGSGLGNNIALGQNGRVRRKRGLGYNEHSTTTPESILSHPNRQLSKVFFTQPFKPPLRQWNSLKNHSPKNLSKKLLHQKSQPKSITQQIRKVAIECLRLVSCRVGRSLFSETGWGPTGDVIMNVLRKILLFGSNRTSWTGRMLRALSFG